MLSGWFGGVAFSSIRRGNAEEWVGWALFGLALEGMNPEQRRELGGLMDRAERHWGVGPLQSGYNKSLAGKCMRLSVEPVGGLPRPLFMYCLVWAARAVAERKMRGMGFTLRSIRCPADEYSPASRMHYWHRPRQQRSSALDEVYVPPPPVLLLHGFGAPASLAVLGVLNVTVIDVLRN